MFKSVADAGIERCTFHRHWCEVCLVEAFRSPHHVGVDLREADWKENNRISIIDEHLEAALLVLLPPGQQHYHRPEAAGPSSPRPVRGGDGTLFIPAA